MHSGQLCSFCFGCEDMAFVMENEDCSATKEKWSYASTFSFQNNSSNILYPGYLKQQYTEDAEGTL